MTNAGSFRNLALGVALVAAGCGDASPIGTGGMGGGDAGTGGVGGDTTAVLCNGHEEFCDRRYDEVSYVTAHNAMSNDDEMWFFPNQNFGITRQLNDGVRGFMLDTYFEEDTLLLCHVVCSIGQKPLVDGLAEIVNFLQNNPREVVSIIFENYITPAQTASAFEESGLDAYVYQHEAGQTWPTLRTLIDSGTRLVAFQEGAPDPAFPWLMNIWEHAWETHFSWETPADFNCNPNRGNPSHSLFILNHFLTGTLGGSLELSMMVNFDPLFQERADLCKTEGSALPNFVAVDFYDVGDVFSVVDSLNGL